MNQTNTSPANNPPVAVYTFFPTIPPNATPFTVTLYASDFMPTGGSCAKPILRLAPPGCRNVVTGTFRLTPRHGLETEVALQQEAGLVPTPEPMLQQEFELVPTPTSVPTLELVQTLEPTYMPEPTQDEGVSPLGVTLIVLCVLMLACIIFMCRHKIWNGLKWAGTPFVQGAEKAKDGWARVRGTRNREVQADEANVSDRYGDVELVERQGIHVEPKD